MPSDEVRCAIWTRNQDPDPIGTAPRFDRLVLIEVPLPWPNDVNIHPDVAAAAAAPGTKVLAVVPRVPLRSHERAVTVYRRDADRFRFEGTDLVVDVDDLGSTVAAVAAGEQLDGTPAPPEFLICTHGTRDRCCGSFGTKLHAKVGGKPGVRFRRSSHLGGHRFAPTGMSLPDGRHWAYLDDELVTAIIERAEPTDEILRHYRGIPLLDPRHQILERVALRRYGWDVAASPMTVPDDAPADLVTLRVRRSEIRLDVSGHVSERRQIKVLDCGQPPDLATKTSSELQVVDLDIVERRL